MSYLLIPNETKSNSAVVWLAVIQENVDPSELKLRFGNTVNLLEADWVTYRTQSGRNKIIYQYLKITDLQPASEYVFELISADETEVLSTGSVRTLPAQLPGADEKPFTVLLASCFASAQTGSGALGAAYLNLRGKERVDLKILCGDQVYLDDPAIDFLLHTHSFEDLEERLLANYVRTWTQGRKSVIPDGSAALGFQQFLQNGANYFSSDDHEFWNNAPNKATLVRDSWSAAGRYNWLKIARGLLEMFQSGKSTIAFNIEDLSFFIADTRINRDAGELSFMSASDLNALDDWVQNLTNVGVLVVGQPIFSNKAGFFKGNLGDWNLPDYAQYEDFVRILTKTEHSIIVLTGDVHYGRIARCRIKPGVDIYEVISSPTALVDKKVGKKWHQAPDRFPAFGIPGVVTKQVTSDFSYQFVENHFLLLQFSRGTGGKIKVVLKVCEITGGGQNPTPRKIAEFNI